MPTLRPIRDQSLNHLSAVITSGWGDRCARFESGCAKCIAWEVFDMIEKITDGSGLDDPSDYERVRERFNLST